VAGAKLSFYDDTTRQIFILDPQNQAIGHLGDSVTIGGTVEANISADQIAYAGKSLKAMWAGNQSLGGTTPEAIRIMRTRADVGARVTSDMARAGVRILAGCDGTIAGFCLHDELAAMARRHDTAGGVADRHDQSRAILWS
jgi:hypothetical protein